MQQTVLPKIRRLEDLEIWKRSMNLVEHIYKLTQKFPKEELYGLTSQIRKSAVSIPSNIAEGFARAHSKEYKQFLYVSLGSGSELKTQLLISSRLGYVEQSRIDHLINEINQISKMMMSLIKRLTTND